MIHLKLEMEELLSEDCFTSGGKYIFFKSGFNLVSTSHVFYYVKIWILHKHVLLELRIKVVIGLMNNINKNSLDGTSNIDLTALLFFLVLKSLVQLISLI
jgi:hypothetical protein